ncbi:MAG: hypothetical protein DDT23_00335 [candidate division WS2 bacterium]|nr:hypothetical protein [Candidatus Lithacetigena glycinireducens]
MKLRERAAEIIKGKPTEKITVHELLSSADAKTILPKIVRSEVKEGEEPLYLLTDMLQRINLEEGKMIEVPVVGPMKAGEIVEGGAYPGETIDVVAERVAIDLKVKKIGLICRITEETITQSHWDVIGIVMREAGKALGRYKEQFILREMSLYGRTLFDNSQRAISPAQGTTGRNKIGAFNNTLSYEDFFDMAIALVVNGYVLTDIIMHPLMWVSYAKTGLFGGLSPTGSTMPVNIAKLKEPAAVIQPQIPFAIKATLCPYIPLDKESRTCDVIAVDRDEIGVIVVKEEASTEDFTDPYKDIRAIKVREYYNIGILNEGRAIVLARRIVLTPTYPFDYQITLPVSDARIISGS